MKWVLIIILCGISLATPNSLFGKLGLKLQKKGDIQGAIKYYRKAIQYGDKKAKPYLDKLLQNQTLKTQVEPSAPEPVSPSHWLTIGLNCKVFDPYPGVSQTASLLSGECVNGYVHGKALIEWQAQGRLLGSSSGDFKAGYLQGQAVLRWANGDSYRGNFEKGLPAGQGELHSKKNDIWCRGQLSSDSFFPDFCESGLIRQNRQAVGEVQNVLSAIEDGDIGKVDDWLKQHSESAGFDVVKSEYDKLAATEYSKVAALNQVKAYEDFISEFKLSSDTFRAYEQLFSLKTDGSIESYRRFLARYPNCPQADELRSRIAVFQREQDRSIAFKQRKAAIVCEARQEVDAFAAKIRVGNIVSFDQEFELPKKHRGPSLGYFEFTTGSDSGKFIVRFDALVQQSYNEGAKLKVIIQSGAVFRSQLSLTGWEQLYYEKAIDSNIGKNLIIEISELHGYPLEASQIVQGATS